MDWFQARDTQVMDRHRRHFPSPTIRFRAVSGQRANVRPRSKTKTKAFGWYWSPDDGMMENTQRLRRENEERTCSQG